VVAAGLVTGGLLVCGPSAGVQEPALAKPVAPAASSPPPAVSPTATPSPAAQTGPRTAEPRIGPAADATPTSPGLAVLAAGLIAAALAVILAMTRLFACRRTGARGHRAERGRGAG